MAFQIWLDRTKTPKFLFINWFKTGISNFKYKKLGCRSKQRDYHDVTVKSRELKFFDFQFRRFDMGSLCLHHLIYTK